MSKFVKNSIFLADSLIIRNRFEKNTKLNFLYSAGSVEKFVEIVCGVVVRPVQRGERIDGLEAEGGGAELIPFALQPSVAVTAQGQLCLVSVETRLDVATAFHQRLSIERVVHTADAHDLVRFLILLFQRLAIH